MVGWKPVALFVTVACTLAWAVWLPLLLGPAGLKITHYNAFLPLFVSLGTLGPFIASFIAVRYETGVWGMPSRILPPKILSAWLNLLTAPALTVFAFVVLPYFICVEPGQRLLSLSFLLPCNTSGQISSVDHLKKSSAGEVTCFRVSQFSLGGLSRHCSSESSGRAGIFPSFCAMSTQGFPFGSIFRCARPVGVCFGLILRHGSQHRRTDPASLRFQYLLFYAGQSLRGSAILRES